MVQLLQLCEHLGGGEERVSEKAVPGLSLDLVPISAQACDSVPSAHERAPGHLSEESLGGMQKLVTVLPAVPAGSK